MPPPTRSRPTTHLTGSLFLFEAGVLEQERDGGSRASLQARNDLGVAHFHADRFDAATAVLEPVVEDCTTILGPGDIDTLVAAGNLGMTYMYLDRHEQGLAVLAENVALRERIFGEADPLTMAARHAQGVAHHMAGRLVDALVTLASVAAQRSRILGPAHTDTLTSRVALALARADTGDTLGAVPGLMAALEDVEHSVGPRSVPAVTIRVHLADCYAELGYTDDAVTALRRAAADCEEALGPTDPLVGRLKDEAFALQAAGAAAMGAPPRSAGTAGPRAPADTASPAPHSHAATGRVPLSARAAVAETVRWQACGADASRSTQGSSGNAAVTRPPGGPAERAWGVCVRVPAPASLISPATGYHRPTAPAVCWTCSPKSPEEV